MKNSCYGCEKRRMGCHSTCEDYQKFKAERETINQEKAKRRQVHDDLNSMATESIARNRNGGNPLRKYRRNKHG